MMQSIQQTPVYEAALRMSDDRGLQLTEEMEESSDRDPIL